MNQENAPATVRDDPRSPATENLEAIFEPCDFWQRRSRKSHHELSLEIKINNVEELILL